MKFHEMLALLSGMYFVGAFFFMWLSSDLLSLSILSGMAAKYFKDREIAGDVKEILNHLDFHYRPH